MKSLLFVVETRSEEVRTLSERWGIKYYKCMLKARHYSQVVCCAFVAPAALMMKSEERTSKVAVDADGTVISDTASSISTDVSGIDCVLNTLESHLAHYSWIDERLEALENCADDGDELDEFVSAADIDSIFAQVAAFVADVEKVVASEVSSIDMESARQSLSGVLSPLSKRIQPTEPLSTESKSAS
ncbi:hypothetical protein GN244_ATG13137 [Phytophthora infestans]|uniref:Uncharacterized protein n=1 Tax=Phytophthora infestans TaxID=4787 RepID=A0A833WAG2_PHYIN|nr:hypothetical protein GN244_ATG13137 [Phytophthora infestans]